MLTYYTKRINARSSPSRKTNPSPLQTKKNTHTPCKEKKTLPLFLLNAHPLLPLNKKIKIKTCILQTGRPTTPFISLPAYLKFLTPIPPPTNSLTYITNWLWSSVHSATATRLVVHKVRFSIDSFHEQRIWFINPIKY